MTDRRGFLGSAGAALASIVFGRPAPQPEVGAEYGRWQLLTYGMGDGPLKATAYTTPYYKVTLEGRELADCVEAHPTEGWAVVLEHKDGDDFDSTNIPYLWPGEHDFRRKTLRGDVSIWRRKP